MDDIHQGWKKVETIDLRCYRQINVKTVKLYGQGHSNGWLDNTEEKMCVNKSYTKEEEHFNLTRSTP